jgi:TPR repeat protein
MYEYGADGLPKSIGDAMKWFLAAANHGVAMAQYELGFLYFQGKEVPFDATNAVKWLAHAANQGFPQAENSYGYALHKGIGVHKNVVEAEKWLLLACVQNVPEAKLNRSLWEPGLSSGQIEHAQQLAAEFKPKSEEASSLTIPSLEDLLR